MSRKKLSAYKCAEYAVVSQLQHHCKLRSHVMKSGPFDVKTENGVRIEVKDARINSLGKWQFTIHRHGQIDESDVDFYVFALRGMTRHRIFVVLPAPLKKFTVSVSPRSLIVKYAKHVGNWQVIVDADTRRKVTKRQILIEATKH